MKILLVDDDQALATVFQTALQQQGYEVVLAPDGKSGLEKAKAEKPGFILLDQILPDISGNEVLKALKSDEATKNIPTAMLSNFGQNELMQQAIQMGALDYILKYQVEPQDVANKIKDLMMQQQQQG